MTLIESIFEIKAAVFDLLRYPSNDAIVSKKVQIKYVELIDRFFRENVNLVKPQQREACLENMAFFMSLMDSAVDHYYLKVEE